MKKLFIILAVGLSLSVYSQQSNPTGTVSDLSITQLSVCACDSLDVSFMFRDNNLMVNPPKFIIFYKQFGDPYVSYYQFDWTDIYKMGTSPLGLDTIYLFRMVAPCNKIGSIQFSFSNMNGGAFESVAVIDCTVGIEEYEQSSLTPIYYNFSGQIVEPKQGELLIKQVGKTRIKVLIQ